MIKAHHAAWLSVHPFRSDAWLNRMLAEGFDIHHIDGNHDNNSPDNLVLIDGADHMMLHNGKTRMQRGTQLIASVQEQKNLQKILTIGMAAFESVKRNKSWKLSADEVGVSTVTAKKWATEYAKSIGVNIADVFVETINNDTSSASCIENQPLNRIPARVFAMQYTTGRSSSKTHRNKR